LLFYKIIFQSELSFGVGNSHWFNSHRDQYEDRFGLFFVSDSVIDFVN